jgi:osmoprotectant transport system permease protein
VSTISLVTIGALVGIPSLGSFFTDGFQRAFPLEVAVGFVLVLVLAAVFDVLLTLLGRLLLPWNRGSRLTAAAARVLSQPQPTAVGR